MSDAFSDADGKSPKRTDDFYSVNDAFHRLVIEIHKLPDNAEREFILVAVGRAHRRFKEKFG